MIEYIFFDASLREQFVTQAHTLGIACTLSDDSMGLLVEVSEDISEALADALESCYETIEKEQVKLSKAQGEFRHLAGFRYTLPDGQSRLLPLEPELANRLLQHFSLQEIQRLFEAVAVCTLNPGEEHLCGILASR